MCLRCLILVSLVNLSAEHLLYAQPSHVYSSAVVSGMHLPVWSAKDLGLFRKYGLSVDVVVISGGTIGMQSLLGGSTQTSSSAAVGPINTVLAGGDAVIIGGVLNKNLLKFVARKEILLQAEKALEDPNFYVTDGKVTLVLAPWKIEDYRETEHRGPGLDHVGFKVESLDAFKKDAEILGEVDPE